MFPCQLIDSWPDSHTLHCTNVTPALLRRSSIPTVVAAPAAHGLRADRQDVSAVMEDTRDLSAMGI